MELPVILYSPGWLERENYGTSLDCAVNSHMSLLYVMEPSG